MNPADMYRQKRKRAVDPDAPPRPNLLSHEKTIKETKTVIEQLRMDNERLRQRLDALESKLSHQTTYLNQLHQYISNRKGDLK